jgi:hypothetical protein
MRPRLITPLLALLTITSLATADPGEIDELKATVPAKQKTIAGQNDRIASLEKPHAGLTSSFAMTS